MYFSQLSFIAVLLAVAGANPIALEPRQQQCTDGAVVFGVRGSDPQQTTLGDNPRYNQLPQGIKDVANAIINKAQKGSYLSAIRYPAVNPSTGLYAKSVEMGVQALQGAIRDYIAACPNGLIFAIGYSQGGQVVTTSLGGPNYVQAGGRLTGAVSFADPTYVDDFFPIDAGSGADNGRNGTLARPDVYQSLNQRIPRKIRNYCEAGDQFCDSGTGSDARAIHLAAPQTFAQAASDFLTGKF